MTIDWADLVSIELALIALLGPILFWLSRVATGVRRSVYQNSEIQQAGEKHQREILNVVKENQKDNRKALDSTRNTVTKLEHKCEQMLGMYQEERQTNREIIRLLTVLVERSESRPTK